MDKRNFSLSSFSMWMMREGFWWKPTRRAIEYLFDDSYESEALNAIKDEMTWYDDAQKAYTGIDRILSWSSNRGIKKRLKRLIQIGKRKSRGKS